MEFDVYEASKEAAMIYYFWEGIKLSIRLEIKQRDQKLDSFDKMVEKAVNVKANAALRPHSYIRETD